MPSTESDALRDHYASITERLAADPGMALPALRALFDELVVRSAEPEGVTYAEVDADGVPALWCVPVDASDRHALLYTHGGGFIVHSAASHRKLAGHLARATGARALVIDYRRAPEHPFPAQVEDGVTAYRWLRRNGFDAANLATAGDSAGGNLAVGVPLALRERGDRLPAAIVAFSPYLDLEHLGGSMVTNAGTDVFVKREVADGMSRLYLGEAGSPTDPLANPLHADLTGMPPMFVTAGTHETLLDDARRLVERAAAAGVQAELVLSDGQQHVCQLMAGRAPEADETIAAAGAWVRRRLSRAAASA